MNKEEYELKTHKYRTLKRAILQKDNINLWKRLELYQEEDNSMKSNPDADYITKQNFKNIKAIYEEIDNEINR